MAVKMAQMAQSIDPPINDTIKTEANLASVFKPPIDKNYCLGANFIKNSRN